MEGRSLLVVLAAAALCRCALVSEFEYEMNLTFADFQVSHLLYDHLDNHFYYFARVLGKFWFSGLERFQWKEKINQQPVTLSCFFEPKDILLAIDFWPLKKSSPIRISPKRLLIKQNKSADFKIKFYSSDPVCDFDYSRLQITDIECEDTIKDKQMTIVFSAGIGCVDSVQYSDRLEGRFIERQETKHPTRSTITAHMLSNERFKMFTGVLRKLEVELKYDFFDRYYQSLAASKASPLDNDPQKRVSLSVEAGVSQIVGDALEYLLQQSIVSQD